MIIFLVHASIRHHPHCSFEDSPKGFLRGGRHRLPPPPPPLLRSPLPHLPVEVLPGLAAHLVDRAEDEAGQVAVPGLEDGRPGSLQPLALVDRQQTLPRVVRLCAGERGERRRRAGPEGGREGGREEGQYWTPIMLFRHT